MKINYTDGFKKLPTSEIEEFTEAKERPSTAKKIESRNSYNIFKNTWFLIFLIIFVIILLIWIPTELYWLLVEYNIMDSSKLSIIINSFDKKHNLTNLLRNLANQRLSSYELIITNNYNKQFNDLPFKKFKKNKVEIKFLQFNENDSNQKIMIESASAAKGEYIIFLDINGDAKLPKNYLRDCYINTIKYKLDITEINYYHNDLMIDEMINQPRLYDSFFFHQDSIEQKQYHLTGKIINKNLFFDLFKDVDIFYLENNNNLFGESMILLKLFKRARSYMQIRKLEISRKCHRRSCPAQIFNKYNYNKSELKDILIYLKFLFQYTDKKVLQKRMAAKMFIELLVQKDKTKRSYNKELSNLLGEVADLYTNCDLINDYDIKLINDYRKSVK